MSSPLTTALPYGLRDVKLTPYLDALGTVLGGSSTDLPYAQTFSFSEAEEFQELRGDDKVVTTHGKGAQVSWSLASGGINLPAWKTLSGGTLIEEGLTPNRSIRLRKKGTDVRPWFRVDGQSISDSGGDLRAVVYRCRATGDLSGEFGDGEFFVTNCSGDGMPLLDETNDLLYDFIQNESKTSITLTPAPNPLGSPSEVQVGALTATTAELTWNPVAGADKYMVERSVTPFSAWTAVTSAAGGEPTTPDTDVTGLTAATAYKFRVKAVRGAVVGDASAPTGVITTPAP